MKNQTDTVDLTFDINFCGFQGYSWTNEITCSKYFWQIFYADLYADFNKTRKYSLIHENWYPNKKNISLFFIKLLTSEIASVMILFSYLHCLKLMQKEIFWWCFSVLYCSKVWPPPNYTTNYTLTWQYHNCKGLKRMVNETLNIKLNIATPTHPFQKLIWIEVGWS